MNFSDLYLSQDSIDKEFSTNGSKRDKKSKLKSGFELECDKCDYKSAKELTMYRHRRIKHSGIKHKCTECDYTHLFPSKVRSHHKRGSVLSVFG